MKQLLILFSSCFMPFRSRSVIHNGYFSGNSCATQSKGSSYFRLLLLFFIGISSITSVAAESKEMTSKYDLEILGAKVGKFSVTQKDENGNVNIEAITDVKISLLFSYRVKYVQNTVYEKGVLKSSVVKTYKNGKLNSDTILKHEKNAYLLVVDGDTTFIDDSITYSGSLIYFNEPVGIKNIYKERSAEIMQISSVSEHVYITKDEKDREINRYYYEEGILQYAKMKHTLGTIELKKEITDKIND